MGSIVDVLMKKQLLSAPSFMRNNVHYETMVGSEAYGVSSNKSDIDIYGFCIPPKSIIFPHLAGKVEGFGKKENRFEQYQQHHIMDKSSGKEYDITIFSIIKFFQLCMDNNPNMIDTLFVPRRCILHSTQAAEHVRENRKAFLHKGAWFKFKGYAYSQVHKMKIKKPDEDSNRYEMVQKFGYDVKFGYNVVRLLNEIEQILTEKDLDLERNREQLKSIRRGEWSLNQIVKYFETKEKELEALYTSSDLQHSPDEEKIKNILLECLEMHYGSLSDAIKLDISPKDLLDDISGYIETLRKKIK